MAKAVKKKKKSTRGPGRPLGSDDYKPEYADMLVQHLAKGKSYSTFAAIADCCVDTLYEWEKKHQDFSDAKRRGLPKSQLVWEDRGESGLYNETFKDDDGMTVSRSINSAVWIYTMKCRFPKDWRDKQETAIEVKTVDSEAERVQELIAILKGVRSLE